jgi:hypothetical protein
MVKQRFLVLFRRWLVTVAKVFGPILLFEVLVSVRQYLQLAALGISDLLMGAFVSLLLTASLCGLWAWGEWSWSKLLRLRGFASELRLCSRNYWSPEPMKAKRA